MGRKIKLSFEGRLEICKKALEGESTYKKIAEEYNVSRYSVIRYLALYRKHGKNGLKLAKGKNRSYSKEFKLEIIRKYLDGSSPNFLSIEYNISKSIVQRWIKRYNRGILKPYEPRTEIYTMKSKKTYTEEEKLSIAKECIDKDRDYKSICLKYDVKYSNLYSWVRSYDKKMVDIQLRDSQTQEEKVEILLKLKEKEIEMLRAENEILKKNDEILEKLLRKK